MIIIPRSVYQSIHSPKPETMKKLLVLLIGFTILSGVYAQNLKIPTSTDVKKAEKDLKSETQKATSQLNIGSLISQLAGGLSDGAFTDSFKKNKSDFITKTNQVTDAGGASSALQSLQGGLASGAMDAGWAKVKDKWLKDAKSAKTVKEVAGLTGTLEGAINDKYFKGDWAKARPAWQTALQTLAK